MKILKLCRICDRILGELEIDDLTVSTVEPIMDVIGNVAYALCPDCLADMETLPQIIYQ